MKHLPPYFTAALILVVLACSPSPEKAATSGKLRIAVGLEPARYLTKRLAGEQAEIFVLLGPGQNPHSYEITPAQMKTLTACSAYLSLGMPFEETLVPRLQKSAVDLKIFPLDSGIVKTAAPEHEETEAEAHHSAEELDPHIWLSPANLQIISKNIYQALTVLQPERTAYFDSSLAVLQAEIAQTDSIIRTQLAPYQGSRFYVYHPAFGYFARDYGLLQMAVETGGKSPAPKALAELIRRARQDSVKVIFVQPQFDASAAQKIAEAIGGRVIPLDGLEYEVLESLKKIAGEIAAAGK